MSSPDGQTLHADNSRFWRILNSAFFLWFMSTIVIGVASYFYSTLTENRQFQLQTNESIRKLDLEVANRLSFFGEQILARVDIEEALLVIENPKKSDFPVGVFPEFYDRSMSALLWDLHSLVPIEEKDEIKKALDSAKDFKKVYLSTIEYPEVIGELFGEVETESLSGKSENNFLQPVEREKESSAPSDPGTTPETMHQAPDKPFEINVNVSIHHEIIIKKDKAVSVLDLTFRAFNIERWDKPFQDFITKLETITTSTDESTGTSRSGS